MKTKIFSSPFATIGFFGILLASTVATASGTDFIGSTVTGTLYNPNLSTILGGPTTTVVGASNPTFPNGSILGNTAFQINITSDQIIYDPLTNVTYSNGTFNGFVFQFSGAPTITGVSLDGTSNFVPTAISFTGNSINLNLSGNTVTASSQAILNVTFAPTVPLPASASLMLSSLVGLATFARKRR